MTEIAITSDLKLTIGEKSWKKMPITTWKIVWNWSKMTQIRLKRKKKCVISAKKKKKKNEKKKRKKKGGGGNWKVSGLQYQGFSVIFFPLSFFCGLRRNKYSSKNDWIQAKCSYHCPTSFFYVFWSWQTGQTRKVSILDLAYRLPLPLVSYAFPHVAHSIV